MQEKTKKLGLALSGSGNRIAFYVGFLEVFLEEQVEVSYIAASSGASLVAACYAAGSLKNLKEILVRLEDSEEIKKYIVRSEKKGGLYSLDLVEEEIRKFTADANFEDVRPLMGFLSVDIETGEQIVLNMGNIAKAAKISCTLPGVFEPEKWGDKTLVDGGLLNQVPAKVAKDSGVDVVVGVNMRGTKHIFTETQMNLKKIFNLTKKLFFIEQLETWFSGFLKNSESLELEKNPSLFTVLGKSMDLAILASKNETDETHLCDLLISPEIPMLERSKILQFEPFYSLGRKCAHENLPEIKKIINT